MITCRVFKLIWLLFFIEIATSRTVTHYETKIDSDGNKVTKTYTSTDNNDAPQSTDHLLQSFGTSSEPFQTFNRNGATIRIKPQTETIRIGGSGIPIEDLVKQAGIVKGMDPAAVRELLNTKLPVTRNVTDENGKKRTTTYKLEPDGSITSKSVTDISASEVDEQFRNLFANQPNYKANTDPLADDAEWTSISEPTFNTRFNRPSTNWHTNTNLFPDTKDPIDNWPKFEDIPKTNYKPRAETTTIRLPETWDPAKWYSSKTFTSRNFPTNFYNHDDDNSKINPFDSTNINVTPGTKTTTYTDDNGTKVTTTYTVGPTKWTHNTKTWTDREPTTPRTATTTTIKRNPMPNLYDFLKSQYDTTTALPDVITTTKINDFQSFGDNRPVKRINLDELPVMEVLNTNNNNNPIDETYVRNIPSDLRPIVGPQIPIKTIKIENIPRTDEIVETTQVKSLTKTVHTNTLPTSADLDPSMRDILQKAGINPDKINSINGDAITKTRVEPDGRVVKTTYRVRTVPPVGSTLNSGDSGSGTNRRSPPFNELTDTDDFPEFDNAPTRSIYNGAPTSTQPNYFSSSHTNSKFPSTFSNPSSERHHTELDHPRPQPPISSYVPSPSGRSDINDFLTKINLSANDILNHNGELIKTIVDEDGRVLTATFLLSSVRHIPEDNVKVSKERQPARVDHK